MEPPSKPIDAATAGHLADDIHGRAVEIIDREGITGIFERQRRYDEIVGRRRGRPASNHQEPSI